MDCAYYNQQLCTSCQWMSLPYSQQLQQKQQILSTSFPKQVILETMKSSESAFRNKAKMAVLGTVDRPLLGIMTQGQPVDLCDCPLYSTNMRNMLHNIKQLIKTLQLVPYNLNKRKGELKYIILTEADNKFMLRFILRSTKHQAVITEQLAHVQQQYPQLVVISINIQPLHAAILEGEQEIILTQQKQLTVLLNNIPLFIRPNSFFQTNTDVAAKLYLTAKQWLAPLNIRYLWDLFCGCGGFGLHCVQKNSRLMGIEISAEAIECAKLTAKLIEYKHLTFKALDATQFATNTDQALPELILVNPLRRGLGLELTQQLAEFAPKYLLYSSCNINTLLKDIDQLINYQIHKVQLFDMFPHTEHMEVLVLLEHQ